MRLTPNRPLSTIGFSSLIRHSLKNDSQSRYVFILGAGASVESGIPSGGDLVTQWLREIQEREADPRDRSISTEAWTSNINNLCELTDFSPDLKSQFNSFTWNSRAKFYWPTFELRFLHNRTEGYSQLIKIMSEKRPSPGYFFLAQLMNKANFNTTITTNFDSLISDSFFELNGRNLLEIGHYSLAGFINSQSILPTVIKIHHDVLFEPVNDRMVNTLNPAWKDPLVRVLESATPIIIGYGGNDGGLMDFLINSATLKHGVYWCSRTPENLPPEINRFIDNNNGRTVKIKSFDELLCTLITSIDDTCNKIASPKHIEQIMQKRVHAHINSYLKMINIMREGDSPSLSKAVDSLLESFHKNEDAFWLIKINNSSDTKEKESIFSEALNHCKTNNIHLYRTYGAYANSLAQKKDIPKAKEYYELAISGTSDAQTLTNYANFLFEDFGENTRAGELYESAFKCDNNNIHTIANYMEYTLINKNLPKFLELAEIGLNKADKNSGYGKIITFLTLISFNLDSLRDKVQFSKVTTEFKTTLTSKARLPSWNFSQLWSFIDSNFEPSHVEFFKTIGKSIISDNHDNELAIHPQWAKMIST